MKAERFITLDIGPDCIRMAAFIRHSSGLLEVVDIGSVSIESDSVMVREAAVAVALKRLLDQKKPGIRRAYISIDSQSVFSRLVRLPPVPPDKMEQTIRHEAVQNIPFPIDDVVWDAHVIDSDALEPEVLLVAAKKDMVSGLVKAVSANGLMVEGVDAAPAALVNLMRHVFDDTQEPMLLVDVGSHATNLIFTDGDRTFFRTLPGRNTNDRLLQEVERSIAFYCGQHRGHAPQRIFVAGEISGAEEVEARLGLVPERIEFWSRFNLLGKFPSRQEMMIVAGAAIRSPLNLNLMPTALQKEYDSRQRLPLRLISMVAVFLIIGLWIFGLARMNVQVRKDSFRIGRQIKALERIEQKLLPMEQRERELFRQAGVFREALRQRAGWLETMQEIGNYLPEGMFLLSSEPINDDAGLKGIRIEVVSYLDREAEGQDTVRLFRDSLRESDLFSEESKISKRPLKELFYRQFVLDLYFDEARL